jgi:hypothetical protein
MDIIYRKDTLYVYLDESLDSDIVRTMESRVNNIMSTYNIENLVINTNDSPDSHLLDFQTKYNSSHKSKVVIK